MQNFPPNINPELFSILGAITGLIVEGDYTANELNSIGNWIILVGQFMLTTAAQQQLINGRYQNNNGNRIKSGANNHSLNNKEYSTKEDLNNLINYLKKLESKLNLQLGLFTDNSNFLGFIEHSICSQYLDDFINALRCLFIADKSLQYAYIYDTVCEYLDTQFCKNKICDFQNDKCIANRAHLTAHEDMGCCYSFEYCNFFETKFIKNIKLCEHLINKTCSTKCITCKLFTCKYLKEKHIKFDTHKILLLDCFFDKKQHLILNSNFFKTREDILNKLLEENHDFYFWYVLKKRFKA